MGTVGNKHSRFKHVQDSFLPSALLLAQNERLPDIMLGKFKMVASKGLQDLMKEIGVDGFKLALACSVYPEMVTSQDDEGSITVLTNTNIRSKEENFKLNVPYQDKTLNDREIEAVVRLQGDLLIKNLNGED